MFLNLGPNHPSAHGAFRIVLQLDGEEIVDCVPDIGYHHRGAEKMGERQSWHSYIPYTDRVDYLGGVMNNLPYVLALEKLAGIEVPDRVKTDPRDAVRVLPHLVAPAVLRHLLPGRRCDDARCSIMFVDRQKGYDVIEAITGFRMHPAWFRIGGLAHDLPIGWEKKVREFIDWLPKRLDDYRKSILTNAILVARSRGVAPYTTRRRARLGHHRRGIARDRLRLRLAQSAAVLRLRQLRFRRADRRARRRLRSHAGARTRRCANRCASSSSA